MGFFPFFLLKCSTGLILRKIVVLLQMEYLLWGDHFRGKFALIFNRKPLINYFTMLAGLGTAFAEIADLLLSIC